jgi:UDP:flavonoid glycosyltransferase YjiC (YdhE family)
VLVGLSSIYQNQGPLLQRTVDALSALPVRAVVTLGRMLEPDDVAASPNVTVVRAAPHSVLLADTSVVITACGHGTAMKTLAAGVPIVCIPMGRDQDAIAARVAELGAGIVLPPSASAEEIGGAVLEVLGDEGYTSAARTLASTLSREHAPSDVVFELEDLVARNPIDRD